MANQSKKSAEAIILDFEIPGAEEAAGTKEDTGQGGLKKRGQGQREKIRPRKTKTRSRVDEALDSGIAKIWNTWRRIERRELRGAYGVQKLLQDIYTVYCGWEAQDIVAEIYAEQNERLGVADCVEVDVLSLLIQAALPHIESATVDNWVGAIRYGQHCHVRPYKLRGFLWVKGGLARCARLYRELKGSGAGDDEFHPISARRGRRSV